MRFAFHLVLIVSYAQEGNKNKIILSNILTRLNQGAFISNIIALLVEPIIQYRVEIHDIFKNMNRSYIQSTEWCIRIGDADPHLYLNLATAY